MLPKTEIPRVIPHCALFRAILVFETIPHSAGCQVPGNPAETPAEFVTRYEAVEKRFLSPGKQ